MASPKQLNPFLASVSILYPLKIPENQRFSGVFRGYKVDYQHQINCEKKLIRDTFSFSTDKNALGKFATSVTNRELNQ